MPWVEASKCNGCGACVPKCPEDAIHVIDKKAQIDQSKCTYCGVCFDACPTGAIRPNSENPALRGRRTGYSRGIGPYPLGMGRGMRRGMGRGMGRGRW